MFGKLERTASVNKEGLGLGLRICKQLVEQNGGEISVYSGGLQKGSCFSFFMVVEQIENTEENVALIEE